MYSRLAGVELGDGFRARVMGVINVSPESFYKGSVRIGPEEVSKTALEMEEEGADFIDIGASSTAPYLEGGVSIEEEKDRIRWAIKAVADSVSIPISVDTIRSEVADLALRLGAEIVNDVSGLKADERMGRVVRERGAGLILSAHERFAGVGDPVSRVLNALRESLKLAESSGIELESVVVDPAIGFFRNEGRGVFSVQRDMPWYLWDLKVLKGLRRLRELGRAVCVSTSRKSFIGAVLGLKRPEDRLFPSLATEIYAVMNGASLIRTHDVAPTVQAIRMVEAIAEGL